MEQGMLMVKRFMVGMLSTNCYVAFCKETREAVVIDPGMDCQSEVDEVTTFIKGNGLKLKFIVNTHGHPDHSCGNGLIKDVFQVPVCIHEDDAYMLGESGWDTARYFGYHSVAPSADVLLRDGECVKFGNIALKVVHSPGHSPGSILLVGEKEAFTGDTLFAGSIGRTDFPGSSDRQMQLSLRKVLCLPDYFVIYPGHESVTTMSDERRSNPFLQGLI